MTNGVKTRVLTPYVITYKFQKISFSQFLHMMTYDVKTRVLTPFVMIYTSQNLHFWDFFAKNDFLQAIYHDK